MGGQEKGWGNWGRGSYISCTLRSTRSFSMSLRILLIAVGGRCDSLLIVRKLIVTEIKSLVQVHKDGCMG